MVNIQGNLLSTEPIASNTGFNLTHFLQEHADYERKAAEYALSIIGKFPDKAFAVTPLAQIALGSMTIFRELCERMQATGVLLIPESPQNLYLKQLNWLNRSGREDRFLDRVLLGNIAESRCAARFKVISDIMEELSMGTFYNDCGKVKQQHSDLYLEMAYKAAIGETVNVRFEELRAGEEKVMATLGVAAGIF